MTFRRLRRRSGPQTSFPYFRFINHEFNLEKLGSIRKESQTTLTQCIIYFTVLAVESTMWTRIRFILCLLFAYFAFEMTVQKVDSLTLLKPLITDHGHLFNLQSLPNGQYIVSLGGPRGRCFIDIDGIRRAQNFSESPLRSSLFLSENFSITETVRPKTIKVDCIQTLGFPSGINVQTTIIQTQRFGLLIHLVRTGLQCFIGPLFCLLALGLCLGFRKRATTTDCNAGGRSESINRLELEIEPAVVWV